MVDNYKTYIVAATSVDYGFAVQMGWMDNNPVVWSLLGGGGGGGAAALRHGIAKL